MSMHGATTGLTDAARAAVAARLGDNPTIVVERLTGDHTKGITNGDFLVIDEAHPAHGDVVRNRVVKLGDVVIYGPVLVAVSDRLTHDKAANMLRSLAKVAGWPTRPPHVEAVADPDIDPHGLNAELGSFVYVGRAHYQGDRRTLTRRQKDRESTYLRLKVEVDLPSTDPRIERLARLFDALLAAEGIVG